MNIERSRLLGFLRSLYPFYKLNDAMLEAVVEKLETVEISAGTRLFAQGAPAENDALYIVYDGKVRLYRRRGNAEEEVSVLERGEIFGYEMLGTNIPHPVNASALTPLTLLALRRSQIRMLLTQIPQLLAVLRMLLNSYFLRLKVRLPWCDSQEIVHYIANKHPLFLWIRLALPIALALVSLPFLYSWYHYIPQARGGALFVLFVILLVMAGWALWNYVDWSNDYAVITNRRVAYQQKVLLLYESRQEAPLEAILSIAVKTSYWGRVFYYGDVIVRTYAGAVTLPHQQFPQLVANFLDLQWKRASDVRKDTEKSALEETIRQRLGFSKAGSQPMQSPNKPVPASIQPGSVQKLFKLVADMFHLRVEKAGEITYRMHWIILLRQIALPTVLLLGLWVLILVSLFSGLSVLPLGVILGILLLATLGIGFWWVYEFIDWRDDYYVIAQDQIHDVYRKPFGKEDRRSAPLKNIQSVQFERLGLIGLLLNYGTVTILVGDAKLTFDHVYNPSDVQRELFKRLAEREYAEKRAKQEAEQKWVGDWLAAYHRVVQEETRGSGGVSR
ncbi:MAG: cyclic nucleotide-binding domain-containing protein [Anaerolineae bacterium]|nr:cyclic nucleotide-binding domain-containing protein [Anaerolineae bacterium]